MHAPHAAAVLGSFLVASVSALPALAQQDPGAAAAPPDESNPAAQPAAPAPQPPQGGAPPRGGERGAASEWEGPMSQVVYLDAQQGVEYVQLRTFFADFNAVSAGVLPSWGVGSTTRVGAGLRFLGFMTLGLRGRVAAYDDPSTVGPWQIWTLDAELGMRVPLHRLEPHFVLAGGYSSFGGFRQAVSGLSNGLDVHGADARLGFGVDYWVAHNVSVGIDADGELLAIARPGVSLADLAAAKQVGTLDDAKARVLEANGTSVGTAVSLFASAGLHF